MGQLTLCVTSTKLMTIETNYISFKDEASSKDRANSPIIVTLQFHHQQSVHHTQNKNGKYQTVIRIQIVTFINSSYLFLLINTIN